MGASAYPLVPSSLASLRPVSSSVLAVNATLLYPGTSLLSTVLSTLAMGRLGYMGQSYRPSASSPTSLYVSSKSRPDQSLKRSEGWGLRPPPPIGI